MKEVLDLSRFNGNIDFTKVKNAGYNDVILQIGWIGNKENHTLDTKFETYYKDAKANGFNIGVYIYSYCESVNALTSGIDWAIKHLKNKELQLPVFIDLEDDQIAHISKELLTQYAKFFCDSMKMHGYDSGVYANKNWFTNKLSHKDLLNYKIWWAEYNGKSNHTSPLKVDLWQYTSSGKVDGINGKVDISRCFCEENNESLPKTEENNNEPKKEEYEMKTYQNGSTEEIVFQDSHCTKKIGYINPRETAKCYGIVDNKALVVYKVDGTNNYKTGFVKWLGGIVN